MENLIQLDVPPNPMKAAQRLAAILALLRGRPVADIVTEYGMCRSDLYKFRRRALVAMERALQDQSTGPERPANRISGEQERQVRTLCERYPTWSSYRIQRRLGETAPNPRTIQRMRKRWGLPRVTRREPPRRQDRRLSRNEKRQARQAIRNAPHLGARRLSWDLQNRDHLRLGHATITRLKQAMYAETHPPTPKPVWQFYERHHPHSLWHADYLEKVVLSDSGKRAYQLTLLDDYSRAYVFCDLFLNQTIVNIVRALIAAMRTFQVIPGAVLFDNGSHFKGNMLEQLCKRLGIEIIYTSACHPQTNGKLERAFRDDMRDFYQQTKPWTLDHLRQALPDYVHYRNHIRGHQALGGKPSRLRLQEQHRMALPRVLDQLEDYATIRVGSRVLPHRGYVRLLTRKAYFDPSLCGLEVTLYETVEGLEMRYEDQPVAVLRDYQSFRQLLNRHRFDEELPDAFFFESYSESTIPIAGLPSKNADHHREPTSEPSRSIGPKEEMQANPARQVHLALPFF
jgi:transposase InsO family protein